MHIASVSRFSRSTLLRAGSNFYNSFLFYRPGESLRHGPGRKQVLLCSSLSRPGIETLEEETEKKAGWMLKALAAATFTYVGFNVFPLMGDSLVKQSIALLRTKDPLFWRSGASRLTLIATDDERRLKIVDAGGVRALVNMLESASDDDTRREAVKALATLSECDAAVEALDKTGVQPFVNTLSTSSSDLETQQHTLILLERLEQWKTKRSL